MNYQDIIKNLRPEMDKTALFFKNEILGLQTSRAHPSLVEDIRVKVYEQELPIKQLASISLPEPRTLLIQPWDRAIIKEIEKAIVNSALKLSVASDDDALRLTVPPLNEERREQIKDILRDKLEQARVSIRQIRESAWDKIQELEQEGEIRQDDKYRAKDNLQKLIDEYKHKLEEMADKKEQEIMVI